MRLTTPTKPFQTPLHCHDGLTPSEILCRTALSFPVPDGGWQGLRKEREERDPASGHAKILATLESCGFGTRGNGSGHGFGTRPGTPWSGALAVKARLARARDVRRLLDEGKARSRAAVARALGLQPCSIVRLLSLLRLAPEIQRYIETATGAPGEIRLTEALCRKILRLRSHELQIQAFRTMLGVGDPAPAS